MVHIVHVPKIWNGIYIGVRIYTDKWDFFNWVVILKYNCTCNCECTIYGRERERENLDFKKKSYCYISFTYLSVIVFLNMFYGASKYSSRWGNSDVILILFHLMICMNFFFRTCIVNGYIFFNHCFFGFIKYSVHGFCVVFYFNRSCAWLLHV